MQVEFDRPNKPVNHIEWEAFNGSVLRERPTQLWVATLAGAEIVPACGQQGYHNQRPRTALGLRSPTAFRMAGEFIPRCGA